MALLACITILLDRSRRPSGKADTEPVLLALQHPVDVYIDRTKLGKDYFPEAHSRLWRTDFNNTWVDLDKQPQGILPDLRCLDIHQGL